MLVADLQSAAFNWASVSQAASSPQAAPAVQPDSAPGFLSLMLSSLGEADPSKSGTRNLDDLQGRQDDDEQAKLGVAAMVASLAVANVTAPVLENICPSQPTSADQSGAVESAQITSDGGRPRTDGLRDSGLSGPIQSPPLVDSVTAAGLAAFPAATVSDANLADTTVSTPTPEPNDTKADVPGPDRNSNRNKDAEEAAGTEILCSVAASCATAPPASAEAELSGNSVPEISRQDLTLPPPQDARANTHVSASAVGREPGARSGTSDNNSPSDQQRTLRCELTDVPRAQISPARIDRPEDASKIAVSAATNTTTAEKTSDAASSLSAPEMSPNAELRPLRHAISVKTVNDHEQPLELSKVRPNAATSPNIAQPSFMPPRGQDSAAGVDSSAVVPNGPVLGQSPREEVQPLPPDPTSAVQDRNHESTSLLPVRNLQVHAAHIFQGVQGTEMRIGMRTEIFGAVEVHASVADRGVDIALKSQHGDLRGWVTSQLPELQAVFQQHDLRLDHINALPPTADLQPGFSAGSERHQQHSFQQNSFSQHPSAPLWESSEDIADSEIVAESKRRLNVRA